MSLHTPQMALAMSDNLTAAVRLLAKFRSVLASYPRILWSSTTISVVLLVLRYVIAKKRKQGKYIVDLSQVGSTAQGTAWEARDYDVIIVGGGNRGFSDAITCY
jgi:hypothetical protein